MSHEPDYRPAGCFPQPCQCCECRGVHCLIPHPGHSHVKRGLDNLGEQIAEALLKAENGQD